MQVQSLPQEDPLEKEMATHSIFISLQKLNSFLMTQLKCHFVHEVFLVSPRLGTSTQLSFVL